MYFEMKWTKGKLTHGMKSHVHVSTWHMGEGNKCHDTCHEEEQVGDTWKPCVTPLGQTQWKWKKISFGGRKEKEREGEKREGKERRGKERK